MRCHATRNSALKIDNSQFKSEIVLILDGEIRQQESRSSTSKSPHSSVKETSMPTIRGLRPSAA